MLQFPISVSAIAFDLDGTLVETLPDLHEAAVRMLTGLGLPPVPQSIVRMYIGDGVDRLVKRLLTNTWDGEPLPALFEKGAEQFRIQYAAVLTRASRPFAGVMPAIELLRSRSVRLACITNKPKRFTQPLLEALGMTRHFDLVLSGDSLPAKKPDAMPLLHTAQFFAIAPKQLLMVGDSPVDTLAARAAGCPVFCVPYGYRGALTVQDLDCDAIVPTLLDLLKLIKLPQS